MRKSILLIALAFTAFGASTAIAQDGGTPEDTGRKTFTGPRIETTIGFDQSEDRETGHKIRGMRAGGAIGYDVAIGDTFTLGAEAGIGWGVTGNERIMFGLPNGQNFNFTMSAGHDIDISVRLGTRLGKNTLFYGKAGWADAAYRYRFDQASQGSGVGNTDNGLRAGLGLEQMLGKHVYAKAEYRYSRYDDGEMTRQQLLTGLGVRF